MAQAARRVHRQPRGLPRLARGRRGPHPLLESGHGVAPLRPAPARSGRCCSVPVTDADLAALAALLPDDVELDPRAERFPGWTTPATGSAASSRASGTRAAAGRRRSWCLDLGVEAEGELVGLQTLEGDDFGALRTVDSASWLVVAARGRGIGTAMRAAALGLAFDHLGAVAAITSAVLDNHAQPRGLATPRLPRQRPQPDPDRDRRRRAPAPAAHRWTRGGPPVTASRSRGVEPCLRVVRRCERQRAASTARNASSPGSAWTNRIRRFTVAAP